MKHSASALLVIAAFFAAPVQAIEFWHSNTVFANQGQCSAVFTFDSGFESVQNLRVAVAANDQAGQRVSGGTLEIAELGGSSVGRYADALLEGSEMCAGGLTIVVEKATATIRGKQVDLLKDKGLTAREFAPYRIQIAK